LRSTLPRGRRAFDGDELLQTYIVHYLQVLGEAAFRVPEGIQEQYPQVPWAKIRGMRHILVHDYFRIDLDIVWAVVEKELLDLKCKVLAILNDLSA